MNSLRHLNISYNTSVNLDHVKTLISGLTELESLKLRGTTIPESEFINFAFALSSTKLATILSPGG